MAKNQPEIKTEFKPTLEELDKKLAKRIKEINGQTVEGFVTPHKKAAIFLDQWVQRNFRGEGSLVGGWKPFKIGGRKKKGQPFDASAKLLQDTGRLKASFLPFADSRDAGIGSILKYSKLHEKGKGALPARPMLPTHKLVDKDLYKIYNAHVAGLCRKPL